MKITANEEYGLRIILRLALILEKQGGSLVSLNEIADAEGFSVENTAAILSKLREGELIESVRGKYGGYKLAGKPEEINLYQILQALSKDTFGLEFCESHAGIKTKCVHNEDCSVRPVWTSLSALIQNFLAGITLRELMQDENSCASELKTSFRVLQDITERNLAK
jgi:Rrf2 family iron-sulfur cluster assembly transcriptional regulator